MCGIYGTTLKYSEQQVQAKLKRTAFRGPDKMDWKSYEYNNDTRITFGHNRLSIIDLDPRSNQPMVHENLTIVFNGEIYNYLDIKKELSDLGYTFKTESDIEVFLLGYK